MHAADENDRLVPEGHHLGQVIRYFGERNIASLADMPTGSIEVALRAHVDNGDGTPAQQLLGQVFNLDPGRMSSGMAQSCDQPRQEGNCDQHAERKKSVANRRRIAMEGPFSGITNPCEGKDAGRHRNERREDVVERRYPS